MEFSRGNPCILRHDLPPPSSNDIPVAKGATPGDRAVGMSPCITLEKDGKPMKKYGTGS
jgi:hypothetical protein